MTAAALTCLRAAATMPEPAVLETGAESCRAQGPVESRRVEDDDPELWLYRERTTGLLKRYVRLSIEVGRLPSLLGREFFRTRVTSYNMATFEDVVIFVHDVERSLEKLDAFDQKLIAAIVLEEYSEWDAARMMHCSLRTIERYLPEAVDRVSQIFLANFEADGAGTAKAAGILSRGGK